MNKVIVVQSHPDAGWSMIRYSKILIQVYASAGIEIKVLAPTNSFSKYVRIRSLEKFVIYLEKYPLFMIRLLITQFSWRPSCIHISDHSEAMLVVVILPWIKRIITVHDQFAVQAALGEFENVKIRLSGKLYQKLNMICLSKFDYLLCASQNTLNQCKIFYPNTSLKVFYNQIDKVFTETTVSRRVTKKSANEFFLIVNSEQWRKNRLGSLGVWVEICAQSPSSPPNLVIVGNELSSREKSYLNSVKNKGNIEIKLKVTDKELRDLYSDASALIFMTYFEGFGYPVVEANACGTLAIASDIPVLREISGTLNFLIPNTFESKDLEGVKSFLSSSSRIKLAKAHVTKKYSIDGAAVFLSEFHENY